MTISLSVDKDTVNVGEKVHFYAESDYPEGTQLFLHWWHEGDYWGSTWGYTDVNGNVSWEMTPSESCVGKNVFDVANVDSDSGGDRSNKVYVTVESPPPTAPAGIPWYVVAGLIGGVGVLTIGGVIIYNEYVKVM